MPVCHVLLLRSGAEIHFIETTHIVYTVLVLHQHKGMVFVRWDGDDLVSMVQWFIMRLYSQINSFGPFWVDWKAAERSASCVRSNDLMLAVRRAHQHRELVSCVLCIFPSAGIAFWIYACRNEKRWAFYVNWLLSAHPRPVIKKTSIRRNKPRTRRNSIKASHVCLK